MEKKTIYQVILEMTTERDEILSLSANEADTLEQVEHLSNMARMYTSWICVITELIK